MKRKHVFCLGHTSVDIFVHQKDLESLQIGGTIDSPNISIQGGGDAANVSYWLGALGANVSLIGVIADDPAGFFLQNDLERVNVNCYLKKSIQNPTASILSVVERDGERSFIINGLSQDELTFEDIPFEKIQRGDLFYTSTYTIQNPPIDHTVMEIVKRSKVNGLTSFEVMFNLASYTAVTKHQQRLKEYILPYIDILVGNLDEYAAFLRMNKTELQPVAMLEKIITEYPNIAILILTDGSNGCYFIGKNDRGQIPSAKITVVDSTGAGDGFCAGFILKYVNGASLREALKSGIDLGINICQGYGARYGSSNYLNPDSMK